MPFMPLWFRARGFSPFQLGMLIAAPYFGRSLLGPLLAIWADRFHLRRTPIALLAAGGCLASLPLLFLHGFWGNLVAFCAGSVMLNSVGPLGDVIALREARNKGFAFGWPRGAGTVAYLLANLVVGFVVVRAGPVWVVIWIASAASIMALTAMFMLPATSVERVSRASHPKLFQSAAEPLRQPMFTLAIVAAGCIQASHGFFYSFSTILWQQQGLGAWAGLLWACAGLSEVLFLWFLTSLRERMGAERLLLLSGTVAVVRWAGMSFAPPLAVVFVLQTLHALTYAASYLASLQLVERWCPAHAMSSGLLLNAALSSGVLIGLVTLISGALFSGLGAHAYLAMSALALVGTALAGLLAIRTRMR